MIRQTPGLATYGGRFLLDGEPMKLWAIRVASATMATACGRSNE